MDQEVHEAHVRANKATAALTESPASLKEADQKVVQVARGHPPTEFKKAAKRVDEASTSIRA